jgi:hypothetical protein
VGERLAGFAKKEVRQGNNHSEEGNKSPRSLRVVNSDICFREGSIAVNSDADLLVKPRR